VYAVRKNGQTQRGGEGDGQVQLEDRQVLPVVKRTHWFRVGGFAETNTTNVVIDSASGAEVSGTGLSYHVTVPGEGVVLLDAGRLEFNEAGEIVFVAGPHQVHLEEDKERLCEALA
jgi:hypothetical protein